MSAAEIPEAQDRGRRPIQRLYSASSWGGLSGAPICALEHLSALKSSFNEVCLILPEHGRIEELAHNEDIPVWCSPFEFRGLRRGGALRWFRGLGAVVHSRWRYVSGLRRLLKDKPGILHIHSRSVHLPYALLAGRWAGVPVVVTFHETWVAGREAWLDLWLIRWLAHRAVFLSQAMAREYPPWFEKRATIVYNHHPLPEMRKTAVRPRPVVAMAARMSQAKGTDLFLGMCRRLRETGLDFEAWLVGSWMQTEEQGAAEAFVLENRLENVVRIRGEIKEMDPVYSGMDVLVLPSRRDAFPRVVMEAMCRGIPVVATRLDGIPEMVKDGTTGILVERDDEAGLAAAVERMLKDELLRKRMGAAGRERAKKLFSPEAYRSSMLELYQKLSNALYGANESR